MAEKYLLVNATAKITHGRTAKLMTRRAVSSELARNG